MTRSHEDELSRRRSARTRQPIRPSSNDEDGAGGGRESHGSILRGLLDEHFTLIRATDGRMFGVAHTSPERAIPHDPKSSPLIRAVCVMFLAREDKWPSTTGVSECSSYALAMFDAAPIQHVPLRCHWDRTAMTLHLDTCDRSGTVLRIDSGGVRVVDPPTAFRRGPVSEPLVWDGEIGYEEDFDALWDVVRVKDVDQPIVLAAMLTAWMTETPQPILLFSGSEDSGKTSTARYLLSFVDPIATKRGRKLPPDEREWKSAIAYSRVVLIDNLSGMTPESSDLLCRVSTGGEAASRALYTDDESHVSNLYVPTWLTSIDPGALRGDLASRIVKIELMALDETTRIADSELSAKQEAIRAQVTRAFMWLAAAVFKEWKTVPKDKLGSRMGDFAIAVRCIDRILGTEGEKRLAEDVRDLAFDVVDAAPLALAVVSLMKSAPPASRVTAAELLELLDIERAKRDPWKSGDKGWPRTPKILSASLIRLEPALRKSHGITIERTKSNGVKYMTLHAPDVTS